MPWGLFLIKKSCLVASFLFIVLPVRGVNGGWLSNGDRDRAQKVDSPLNIGNYTLLFFSFGLLQYEVLQMSVAIYLLSLTCFVEWYNIDKN